MSKKKKEDEGILRRVDKGFKEELENIKKQRKQQGMEKTSDRELTKMIPKHDVWHRIKKDLIKFKFDKGRPNDGKI